ncbi:TetR/AcrR family transcriptional regulator [Myroides sp. DW712]|uniref:TetR/AcrR family transcriptional regulator n=1 Tax=Myroides sp. DW712 TaxID=3389800 RepID=UPI00397B67DA
MSGTRERILELGEELVLTKGFNGFSYQDISTALGIKNAAIHYYFASKENLGTSIVKTNIQRFEEMIANMQALQFDPIKKIETFIKIYSKSHRERKLCIVGALSPDIETLFPTTQVEVTKMVDLILNWLVEVLTEGKKQGVFHFQEEEKQRAFQILSSLVASLQLARVNKYVDYKGYCYDLLDQLK